MKNTEFVKIALNIANNTKTLYVMGCFGAPLSATNKARYTNNYAYNSKRDRAQKISNACAKNGEVFGFDCVCLIKGILWGWTGDKSKTYGGASYCANGVKDLSANGFFGICTEKSSDFKNIELGEAVWMDGHIGIYVGDGLAVECTPIWKDGVQLTSCNCSKQGYNRRNWTKHGKIPYVEYEKNAKIETPKPQKAEVQKCPYKKPNIIMNRKKHEYGKIKKGNEGVKWVQWHLKRLGLYNGDVDGFFGPITEASVKKFQKGHKDVNGKPLEVDGSVYVLTIGALEVATK